jgi:hypothetical protein
MRTNFVVSVTHENKPIAGVAIDLYTSDQNGEALLLSGESKADGTFVIANLRPGDYWLGVRPKIDFLKTNPSREAPI